MVICVNRSMGCNKRSIWIRYWWIGLIGLGLMFWVVFFILCPVVPIDEEPCYSPNHEFYIKRMPDWLTFFAARGFQHVGRGARLRQERQADYGVPSGVL